MRNLKNFNELLEILKEHKQDHVLKFWNKLSKEEQELLRKQINVIDFDLMDRLISKYLNDEFSGTQANELKPAEIIDLEQRKKLDKEMFALGEKVLYEGKVAAFLVAGGQGSRLGFEHPKGMYPITPIKKKSLFQVFAEKLSALSRRYHQTIPWYIMASESNIEETRDYFKTNDYFGFPSADIQMFTQDMIPAIDRQGKFILEKTCQIFKNPNGHGGSIKALYDSGALNDMMNRGIEYIFYFQVDNVLTAICDPYFLGYHISQQAEMSSKVVRKAYAEEKMGIICQIADKTGVVEYSDLSDEDMKATNADGSLKYWAGSIATHIFNVDFILRENKDGFRLPYHIAEKKIPYTDEQGHTVSPKKNNGIKFETFVFDALPDAKKTCTLEVKREQEFSALKNKTGPDSPDTVEKDLLRFYSRMLLDSDVEIKTNEDGLPAHKLEISPLFALDTRDIVLKKKEIPIVNTDIYLG